MTTLAIPDPLAAIKAADKLCDRHAYGAAYCLARADRFPAGSRNANNWTELARDGAREAMAADYEAGALRREVFPR